MSTENTASETETETENTAPATDSNVAPAESAATPEKAIIGALMTEAQKHNSVVGVSICVLVSNGEQPAQIQARCMTVLPPCSEESDLHGLVKLIEQNIHLSHLRSIPGALEQGMRLAAESKDARRADE